MKRTMTVLLCLSSWAAVAGFEREDPAKYWDLAELSKIPECRLSPYKESEFPGLKALLVKGKGPKNAEAEFFCYYGVPDGEKPAGGWPAAVMVHGGGGTAFPQLVTLWKKRGFAVIALDWYNQRPAPGLTNVAPTEVSVPRIALKGGKRQDHVANVANMILSHTLVRSFPEVDKDRTVFLGLSWGSWYGACVSAVDDRFKGVIEIYCGDKNVGRDPETWMGFVNGRFLHAAKVPMWWVVWPQDGNVTPASSNAGFAECARFDGCTIVNKLGHSHAGLELESVLRMARYYVGLDTARLPRLGEIRREGDAVKACILERGLGIESVCLGYTTSTNPKTDKRNWKYAAAEIKGEEILAKLPVGATCCYLAAFEKNTPRGDLCGTTPYLLFDGAGAARGCVPSPRSSVCRVRPSWKVGIPTVTQCFVDVWDRTNGVSGWYGREGFCFSPWYTRLTQVNVRQDKRGKAY